MKAKLSREFGGHYAEDRVKAVDGLGWHHGDYWMVGSNPEPTNPDCVFF